MKTIEGKLDARGLRFGVVASTFNKHIVSRLVEGALSTLKKAGAEEKDILMVRVPGAFEIPLAAQKLAQSKNWDAIIALGCVLRGGTHHFDHVCSHAAVGIGQVALKTGVPVIFGILMADAAEQALERAGGANGNRGEEAARSAIEMATLLKAI